MTDTVQAQPVEAPPNGLYIIYRVKPNGRPVTTVGRRDDGDEPDYPWKIIGRDLEYSDASFLKRWQLVAKIDVPPEYQAGITTA